VEDRRGAPRRVKTYESYMIRKKLAAIVRVIKDGRRIGESYWGGGKAGQSGVRKGELRVAGRKSQVERKGM